MKAALIALCVLAGVASSAPTTDRPIHDRANVLSAADESNLTEQLATLRAAGVEMAVVLVDSTGGTSIESYARDIAERWTSGRRSAAVLVLAISDRKSRLEVSDVLRPKFPDARAKSILDNSRGYLRSGDYAGAVRAIIADVSAGAAGVAPDMESPHPQSETTWSTTTEVTSSTTSSSSYETRTRQSSTSYTWLVVVIVVVVCLLGFGAIWAASTRRASGTFSHDGYTIQKSFVADWLWHSLKIIGFIFVAIGVVLAAMAASNSSTSSRSWSSSSSSNSRSSSSTTRSSGGGGWSGGGASSSW